MHELALADAVVKTALSVAADAGLTRISRIVVTVGELQQIDRDTFAYLLTEVMPGTDSRLASAEFVVEDEAAGFRCRACGTGFEASPPGDDAGEAVHFVPELAHAYLRCPGCGSPDFDIVAGRGVTLRTVEGEDG